MAGFRIPAAHCFEPRLRQVPSSEWVAVSALLKVSSWNLCSPLTTRPDFESAFSPGLMRRVQAAVPRPVHCIRDPTPVRETTTDPIAHTRRQSPQRVLLSASAQVASATRCVPRSPRDRSGTHQMLAKTY